MIEAEAIVSRCSRTLLSRHGVEGPGPGGLAFVLARAGEGKTALLTGIGLDALISGRRVLHISSEATVDRVKDWYDDLLAELVKDATKRGDIDREIGPRRHIHSFMDDSLSIDSIEATMSDLHQMMDFEPDVILLDRLTRDLPSVEDLARAKNIAGGIGAELWTSARVFRDGPESPEGHLPWPVNEIEEVIDLALKIEPNGRRMELHVLKDQRGIVDHNLDVALDPTTMLLVD